MKSLIIERINTRSKKEEYLCITLGHAVLRNFQLYEQNGDILCNLRSYMITVITETISSCICTDIVDVNSDYKSTQFHESTVNFDLLLWTQYSLKLIWL